MERLSELVEWTPAGTRGEDIYTRSRDVICVRVNHVASSDLLRGGHSVIRGGRVGMPRLWRRWHLPPPVPASHRMAPTADWPTVGRRRHWAKMICIHTRRSPWSFSVTLLRGGTPAVWPSLSLVRNPDAKESKNSEHSLRNTAKKKRLSMVRWVRRPAQRFHVCM